MSWRRPSFATVLKSQGTNPAAALVVLAKEALQRRLSASEVVAYLCWKCIEKAERQCVAIVALAWAAGA